MPGANEVTIGSGGGYGEKPYQDRYERPLMDIAEWPLSI